MLYAIFGAIRLEVFANHRAEIDRIEIEAEGHERCLAPRDTR
jgi:hypothetical protein